MNPFYHTTHRLALHSRMLLLAALALSWLSLLTAQAQTIRYVSTTGTNTNPATASSWGTATTDLQGAINASSVGDQVWVAAGVYKPTTGIDRTISFSMVNGVAIYGGLAGNEPAGYDMALRTISANQTTLSGEIGDPTSTTDNSTHVISNGTGLTNSAILDGFVITGSHASVSNNNAGGMFNNGNGGVCSPTVRNCVFSNNYARLVGGAIWNYAFSGGNSSPVLINCLFLNNSAFNYGGAIYNEGSNGTCTPTLINCSFQGNRITDAAFGAAIYNFGSGATGVCSPTLTNCSFQDNLAIKLTTQAGAMYSFAYNSATTRPVLTNCVLFGNGGANAIVTSSLAVVTASFSLFEAGVTGFTDGGNNIIGVTTSPFTSNNSTQLSACSPAINTGSNTAYTSAGGPSTDLAANPRFYNGGPIDRGAYEYQGNPFSVGITPSPSAIIA